MSAIYVCSFLANCRENWYNLQHFVIFVLLRAVVGVGEGCYTTIAPTIIADLFADNTRTTAISIFYIAIPVGRYMLVYNMQMP